MRRRVLMTIGLVAVVAGGIPAVAALMTPRGTAPAQISLNVASPAFTVTGLIPGDSMTRCIRARNEGTEAIKLIDGMSVTGELAQYLLVTVEKGTGLGDTGPSCAGFHADGFAYGTRAGGIAAAQLVPEYTASWPASADRSLRITVALPAATPVTAAARQADVTLAFAGYPTGTDTTGTDGGTTPGGTGSTPDLPGGIAPGTSGGFDKNGNFLTNQQIKKKLRIGKARMLKNGDIVVMMYLPAGGAIRAKAILPNGVYYAHTLLPVEWGPKLRVLLKRRPVGKAAVTRAKRTHRELKLRITTRYRWAHGPDAYVQPEQKLVAVKGRR